MIQQNVTNQVSLTSPKIVLAKILVATDFSETSGRALEYGLSLARQYNSRIFLTHVIPLDLMTDAELTEAAKEQTRLIRGGLLHHLGAAHSAFMRNDPQIFRTKRDCS